MPAHALTRSQEAPAAAARPERPQYERVLELVRRAGSSDASGHRAWSELQALATELVSQGPGVDVLDPDTILACSAALSHLARTPARAAELRELAALLDELLEEAPDPDLALALAQARIALSVVEPTGAAARATEERLDELRRALRHAAAIAPADQRDGFGCRLADELYAVLAAAGREEEALDELAPALLAFPGDLELRPYLACALADGLRVRGAFEHAWRWIQEAEAGLARSREQHGERELCELTRRVAGTRCHLELAWGLFDLAPASLERERAAVELCATNPESRLGLLQDLSLVALASERPARLSDAIGELERALADGTFLAADPGRRAQMRARRAVLQDVLEDLERSAEPRAPELVAAALADPSLDALHRRFLELKAIELAHRAGDLDGAAARLAAIRDESTSSPELRAALSAWRATLALARGAERAELELLSRELEQRYQEFLGSWRSAPEREGGLGYLAARSRQLLLGARLDLALRLGGEAAREGAVDLLLPEQALGSLSRRLEAGPGSVAEVRRSLLGAETGMLLYLPGQDVAHLFCIDAETIEHVRIPWKHGRERRPDELEELLARSPAELGASERARQRVELELVARELAERLLPAPARARIARWRGLYVVGADLLGAFPFDCLPLGDEPLARAKALATLPSIPVALALAARPRPASARELLLVAAPALDPGERLAALPFGAEETRALTAGFERTLVLSGREATLDAAAAEQRRSPALVLHFLAHGVSDLAREAGAGLALARSASAPDGRLWCDAILGGAFPASPLVLLSVCGAARGPRRTGDDGLAQLGGAFLAAGARCVLLSAADVALEPTLLLVAAFQREVVRGVPPAEALRVARRELAKDPRFEHPFYWASWCVTGLGLEPVLARR